MSTGSEVMAAQDAGRDQSFSDNETAKSPGTLPGFSSAYSSWPEKLRQEPLEES